jgi:uncharacterized protein
MNREYTLITGASGGFGEALAHRFAREGHNLILVARTKSQLDRVSKIIEQTYGVAAVTFVADLSNSKEVAELYSWTHHEKYRVTGLINNAGFGDRASVVEADVSRLQGMIRLNNEALTSLSKLYAQDMVSYGKGLIVNIASVAGLVPGPGMAVYFATKAYVLSFSQALAAELQPQGIQVTCICPGAASTGFASAAHAENSGIFRGKLPTADDIADFTMHAVKKRKLVAIWGFQNRLTSKLVSLAPRRLVLRSVNRMQV